MKIRVIATLVAAIVTMNPVPVNAVEGGDDASGSRFVVPIKTEFSSNQTSTCSGALIAPYIVVTAGHCVLDNSGLVSKNIYVGEAGSSMQSVAKADLIDSVKITSSFQNALNSTVGEDDLAFLTLKKPQALSIPVFLASESEMTLLKRNSAQLKLIGYGRYGDTSEELVTFPKSYSGVYSQINPTIQNSGYLESTKANACRGDSGSPILSIGATQVTVVGIMTGSTTSKYCSTPLVSTGKYYALFTLIGRYANLAFSSATQSISNLSSSYERSQSDLEDANALLDESKASLESLTYEIENLRSSLESYKKTISSLNAKLKKICSAKPKPKGC